MTLTGRECLVQAQCEGRRVVMVRHRPRPRRRGRGWLAVACVFVMAVATRGCL